MRDKKVLSYLKEDLSEFLDEHRHAHSETKHSDVVGFPAEFVGSKRDKKVICFPKKDSSEFLGAHRHAHSKTKHSDVIGFPKNLDGAQRDTNVTCYLDEDLSESSDEHYHAHLEKKHSSVIGFPIECDSNSEKEETDSEDEDDTGQAQRGLRFLLETVNIEPSTVPKLTSLAIGLDSASDEHEFGRIEDMLIAELEWVNLSAL